MNAAARAKTALYLTLQVAARGRGLPTAVHLRRWARATLAVPARIGVRIVERAEGGRLNLQYRGKAGPTNVLSFGYGMSECILEGDIVLCAPVIREEARRQRKTLRAHYAHLSVHGLLHLQGLDHHTAREARAMEARETAILGSLGYSDPYAHE